MRYVAGALFATAAAAHTAALADALGLAVLIAVGVIAFAFAIEGMIKEALRPPPPPPAMPEPTRCATPLISTDDAALRRMFDQRPSPRQDT